MARQKKPPFGGDKRRESETRFIAQHIRDEGAAYAELDRVREWARDGREILGSVIARFGEDMRAIRRAHEEPTEDNLNAVNVVMMTRAVIANIVRGGAGDPTEVINLLVALDNANAIVRQLNELMPDTAKIGGVDAADEVLRQAGHTVEESARALGMTEAAIERRRNRRK
jgi:hypothetical protein